MSNNPAESKYGVSTHATFGRRKILVDYDYVDRSNILEVLEAAVEIHEKNRYEIQYLWDYYKGKQPVLDRTKEYREEVNWKVVENRAFEIVSFKDGYLMGEPIQYVSVGEIKDIEPLNTFNDWMRDCDKESVDQDIVNWMHVCGVGYRIVNSSKKVRRDKTEAPFYTYSLDPRDTFVVYSSSAFGEPAIMCVKYRRVNTPSVSPETFVFSCYTPERYFEIRGTLPLAEIVRDEFNALHDLPIIEYPLNKARIGCFEMCTSILDAINDVASNRVDAIAQFVDAIMLFHNVDVDDDVLAKVKELGALAYYDRNESMKGDIRYITAELNQMQTQTLVDHMYNTVLTICGMPNRNMNATSTSDTGSSVMLRNGWSDAEARAKSTEVLFRKSEKQFLRLALRIIGDVEPIDLKMADIAIRFTRHNYENIATKANVLSTLIDKIPPATAYVASGMFVDPQAEYEEYKRWKEEQKTEEEDDTEGSGKTEGMTRVSSYLRG